jgi:cytochrome d ubiquinol oxidase subunit I
VVLTIIGFTAVYGVLAVIEVRLMLEAIRKGPDAVTGEAGSFGDIITTTGYGVVS